MFFQCFGQRAKQINNGKPGGGVSCRSLPDMYRGRWPTIPKMHPAYWWIRVWGQPLSLQPHVSVVLVFREAANPLIIQTLLANCRLLCIWLSFFSVTVDFSRSGAAPLRVGKLRCMKCRSCDCIIYQSLCIQDKMPSLNVFFWSLVLFSRQLIQTISAVDTDEPLVGHKFVFSISATNPNFTIVDREGKISRFAFLLENQMKVLLCVLSS